MPYVIHVSPLIVDLPSLDSAPHPRSAYYLFSSDFSEVNILNGSRDILRGSPSGEGDQLVGFRRGERNAD